MIFFFFVNVPWLGNSWYSSGGNAHPTKTHNTPATTRLTGHCQSYDETPRNSESEDTEKVTRNRKTIYQTRVGLNFLSPLSLKMDCWSAPLTNDHEFEKLMIRINPPRYFFLDSTNNFVAANSVPPLLSCLFCFLFSVLSCGNWEFFYIFFKLSCFLS